MNPLITGLAETLPPEQLAKIQQTAVGIAGLGGLGSNVAWHLVRSGFSHLVLADFDRVEASNLNRQVYFPDQLGLLKTEALAENLLKINPDLDLELWPILVTSDNVQSIFGQCTVWVEGFDQTPSKKMFVEEGLASGKKIICASGLAGWGDTDAIHTKHWGSGLSVVGDFCTTVAEDQPPLSPRVGVVAAKQANLVLSWVLDEGSDLL
ncbi:sulfur carrier protein ThiS adenylyltransferase ThiF [Desulfosporosinus metallidurans]|uniref:Sulfur carrier protein adenylyltransferase ThiF n=1 Tax=Desulfosporosinus metallidurans TaxID=1888891 RepID=A0A1Q8QYQ6_9FIRM|nr:sulfur carrier protein ThiS adenylyltransferase ThiF [Desulfosporosinus metallidurans]OLN32508.1 Sulfur carrier protein adenylyltransferase ThiF [Desulfosporosinus metallidurans]